VFPQKSHTLLSSACCRAASPACVPSSNTACAIKGQQSEGDCGEGEGSRRQGNHDAVTFLFRLRLGNFGVAARVARFLREPCLVLQPHQEPRRACNSSSMAADFSKWPGEWHPARNDVALASEAPDPAHLADFKTRLLASDSAHGIQNLMHIDLSKSVSL
jgi:hypothetical protein